MLICQKESVIIHVCVSFFYSSIAQSSSAIHILQKSLSPSNGSEKLPAVSSSVLKSNQDVVRIYVPPADEMIPDFSISHKDRTEDVASLCSNQSSIIHVEYEPLSFERSPSLVDPQFSKTDQTPTGANKFQPQQYYFYPNPSQTIHQQSSSSRRGSMTRKTPSPLLNEVIIECEHVKVRRSAESLDQQVSNDLTLTESSINKFYQLNSNNDKNNTSLKRMTSFEELAKKAETNSFFVQKTSVRSRQSTSNKPKSDYNICYNYKNLENVSDDYSNVKHQMKMKKSTSHSHNIRKADRKHSSSDNSPFDYDLLKEKRRDNRFHYDDDTSDGRAIIETNENSIKSYDRFFNSDDEIEDDEIRQNRAMKKNNSSGTQKYHISGTEADDDENSSNSPKSKSILNTPINETMPLLSNDTTAFHIQASPPLLPSSSNRQSRIPRPNKNDGNLQKKSSVSSPEGSDKSDGYQTSINQYEQRLAESVPYQSQTLRSQQSIERTGQKNVNKIRIKINQKN